MLYNSDFVWCHLGKTGGNTIRTFLARLNEGDIRGDWEPSPYQHESISARHSRTGEDVNSKKYILGIRRLPSWLASHLNMQFGDDLDVETIERSLDGEFLLGPHSQAKKIGLFANVNRFDDLLNYYLDHQPNYILRQENLLQDFKIIFSSFFGTDKLEPIVDERINVLPHSVLETRLFIPENIERIYSSSPKWTEFERKAYSDLA